MRTMTVRGDLLPQENERTANAYILRKDIAPYEERDEQGNVSTGYTWTEIRMDIGEYDTICNGKLPAGAAWNADLHRIFRQAQHDRTLSLYDLARRKAKTDSRWNEYITSLDLWNVQVSALAATLSVTVPPLPAQPA